jgi:hypothetical protein
MIGAEMATVLANDGRNRTHAHKKNTSGFLGSYQSLDGLIASVYAGRDGVVRQS